MFDLTGYYPYKEHPEHITITNEEAAWWLGAYAALETFQHIGTLPSNPEDAAYEGIRDDLGLERRGAGDTVDQEIEEGWGWYRTWRHRE